MSLTDFGPISRPNSYLSKDKKAGRSAKSHRFQSHNVDGCRASQHYIISLAVRAQAKHEPGTEVEV